MKFAIGIAALSLVVSGWASLSAHADDAVTGGSPGYYLDGKWYPGPYPGTAATPVPAPGTTTVVQTPSSTTYVAPATSTTYVTPSTSTTYVAPASGTQYGTTYATPAYGTTYSTTYGGSYGSPYQATYYSSAYTNGYSTGYATSPSSNRVWRAANSGYTGNASYSDTSYGNTYATTSCGCGCYEAPRTSCCETRTSCCETRTSCCDPCHSGLFRHGGFLGLGIGNGY